MYWIVGAQGMLGTYVLGQLAEHGISALATDREVDITDPAALEAYAGDHPITCMVNCAAYTNVRACETHKERAFRVNAEGVRNLVRIAEAKRARIVHLSTDYVFDGTAREPYEEDAVPTPLNVYAESKAAGEAYLREAACPWILVRTAWLFGEGGQSFVTAVLERMRKTGSVKVVNDQRGNPTFARDLAEALVALSSHAPGVYHFVNSGETSWYGFALEITRLAMEMDMIGEMPHVTPVTSEEFNDPVKRPPYSVLATAKVTAVLGRAPRPWSEALREYMVCLKRASQLER